MLYAIASIILGIALLNGAMFLRQPDMVFFPQRQLEAAPDEWGMAYQDVNLLTGDGVKLHGWYVPHAEGRRTVLFFHGNAGNISHRRESIAIFHDLGLNVLIIDYRGYGRSEGSPDEAGLYADADAAWNYLVDVQQIRGKDIIIFGRSLGGAVAADLGARVQAGALVLESTFSSARAMSRMIFPLLSYLVIPRFKFNVAERVRDVHYPVLVLHSPDDDIIPLRLGEAVYAAANQPKTFVPLKGDHNSGFLQAQAEYEQALAQFIDGL
ncbi:MAG: alpha/beta hydrolase [Thiogranum sp.]|nr:alpha/beta hydrolase [Thiogranum sp.]